MIHLELNAIIVQHKTYHPAFLNKALRFSDGQDIRIPQNLENVWVSLAWEELINKTWQLRDCSPFWTETTLAGWLPTTFPFTI